MNGTKLEKFYEVTIPEKLFVPTKVTLVYTYMQKGYNMNILV